MLVLQVAEKKSFKSLLKEKQQRSRYLPARKEDNNYSRLNSKENSLNVIPSVRSRGKRQAIDLLTQREIKCEPLWGGAAAYWDYSHEVPQYCFSE